MTAIGLMLIFLGMTALVILRGSKAYFSAVISLFVIGWGTILLFVGLGVWLWRVAP